MFTALTDSLAPDSSSLSFPFSGTSCQGPNGDKSSPSDAVRFFSRRWDLTLTFFPGALYSSCRGCQ
jgi:hypothetical protein